MVPAGVAVRRVPYLPVKSHQSSTIHQTFAKNQPLKNLRWSGVFAGGRIRSGEVFCTCHNSKSPHSAPKSLSSISVVTIISITGLNLLGNCLSIPGIQDNLLGESRGRADTGNTLFEKKKSTTKVWTSSEPTRPKFWTHPPKVCKIETERRRMNVMNTWARAFGEGKSAVWMNDFGGETYFVKCMYVNVCVLVFKMMIMIWYFFIICFSWTEYHRHGVVIGKDEVELKKCQFGDWRLESTKPFLWCNHRRLSSQRQGRTLPSAPMFRRWCLK